MVCPCFTSPTLVGHRRPRVSLSTTGSDLRMCQATDHETKSSKVSEAWEPGKVSAKRQLRSARGARGLTKARVRIQGYNGRTHYVAPSPSMRVNAGVVRGRRLDSPAVYLRPMMGKVKEALFGMMESLDVLRCDGACLDLFSGTGNVGIEAMSRGMGAATFVDLSEDCVDCTERNARKCGFGDVSTVIQGDVLDVLERTDLNSGNPFELITVTPPYEEVDYGELMKKVARSTVVGDGTFVVVEYPVELRCMPPSLENRLVGLRNRRYGRTVIAVYACRPDVDIEPRPHEFMRL
eukprot:Plantae.Rhodophyta-Hildenbrandia_rubra.ctg6033.p1 GENE.Plantae.Rhodophyta-Hildenbrandia_rubra.ctg6033~~Plantae.Rhodophyta-Hildenbrandia_rubra.ctg6033.p1  ORF type:complete len:293 (+),score=58.64 Plantae.Rhodophyta-Hildenbrandia_rubra.ctg6033:93-971(+)